MLDIGQGDAIFIEAPNGNQMLIDGGPPKTVLSALRKVMPFYDRSIDMLMVTNPDADHMAGFIDVLKSFKVGEVIEPGTNSPSATYAELERTIKEKKVPQVVARRGEIIWLDKKAGVGFYVLFPDRDILGLATNDGSIVGRLVYGNTSVMFTGDSPSNIEHYLVALDGEKLKSDVLKVGHHGSRTSTSEEFVGVVDPTMAIISDGKDNKYGHPHQETLDTLEKFGVKVFRTDQVGTIILKSDGETIRRE
ncbi:MAG: ComEC/Rec2 family competence protein [Patescibacteria group bacterium]